jgi:hypothetical protein
MRTARIVFQDGLDLEVTASGMETEGDLVVLYQGGEVVALLSAHDLLYVTLEDG